MHFEKTSLFEMPCCYAVTSVVAEGRRYHLFATDNTGCCYSVDAETLEREVVWSEPGGTMSLVPLPGTDGEFLASQNFFPGFRSLQARIVRVKRENGAWTVTPWIDLPYVHRFDVIESDGRLYFLGCILSDTDRAEADFDKPGYLVAAELDRDYAPPAKLERIAGGMTRNHGYFFHPEDGKPVSYVGCDEGVFRVCPPEGGRGWQVAKVLDAPCSDMALCDLDGDGEVEMATIQPFHGSDFVVYKRENGVYKEWYRDPNPMSFLHVVWGGTLCGEPVFLGGCRDTNKELFALRWADGKVQRDVIETGFGPSNIAVLHDAAGATILLANYQSAEGALLRVTP